MIKNTLKKLGLKDKEITVYLEVMKYGRTTPAKIAITTNLNRATVYSVAKVLVKKGLITEDYGGKVRYLNALPSKDLEILILRNKQELDEKKELVAKAVSELDALPSHSQHIIPHMRFIDENEFKLKMRENMMRWEKSLLETDPTKTVWGFQDHAAAEMGEKDIDWYWSRAPKEVELKLLSNEAEIEEKMDTKGLDRRVIKPWNKPTDFTASTWIWGEYVIVAYTHQHPYYALEIYNDVVAHNYRELFKNIWDNF